MDNKFIQYPPLLMFSIIYFILNIKRQAVNFNVSQLVNNILSSLYVSCRQKKVPILIDYIHVPYRVKIIRRSVVFRITTIERVNQVIGLDKQFLSAYNCKYFLTHQF